MFFLFLFTVSLSRCHCSAEIAFNTVVIAVCINEYRTKSQTAVLTD